MTSPEQPIQPYPPLAGDETATLLGFLDCQRATLAWKCAGWTRPACGRPRGLVDDPGWVAQAPGLRRERLCSAVAARARTAAPVGRGGMGRRPRLGLALGPGGHPRPALCGVAGRRRPLPFPVAEALATVVSTGRPCTWPDGRSPSLRYILFHLIEEYARHVGHADLIRESVDGLVGEDPPED